MRVYTTLAPGKFFTLHRSAKKKLFVEIVFGLDRADEIKVLLGVGVRTTERCCRTFASAGLQRQVYVEEKND